MIKKIFHYILSIPVTILVAVILITVYLLQMTRIVSVNCKHTFLAQIATIFFHGSPMHLISNLTGLALVSKFEYQFGSMNYFLVLLTLICITNLLEYFIRFHKKAHCSIGFSGILIGIAIIELVHDNDGKFDWNAVVAILVVLIYPQVVSPKTSLLGHSVGALTGVIIAFLYTKQMIKMLQIFNHTEREVIPLLKNIRLLPNVKISHRKNIIKKAEYLHR